MEYIFKNVNEAPKECIDILKRLIEQGVISKRCDGNYHIDIMEIILIIGRLDII